MKTCAVGLVSVLILAGCGSQTPACVTSFSVSVVPTLSTPVHGVAAPGDQQKFTAASAETVVSGKCAVPEVIPLLDNAIWTTSDPINTQVDSTPGPTNGLATCLGATTVPATITASVTSGSVTKTATAPLTCK